MVKKLLDIDAINKDSVFKANIHHIRTEIVNEPELFGYFSFDQLKYKSGENSAYSLLYSTLIEQMLKGKLKRVK